MTMHPGVKYRDACPLRANHDSIGNAKNFICGYGEIGRHAGFRFQFERVQVQVLLSAPSVKTLFSGVRTSRRKNPFFRHTNKSEKGFFLLLAELKRRCGNVVYRKRRSQFFAVRHSSTTYIMTEFKFLQIYDPNIRYITNTLNLDWEYM